MPAHDAIHVQVYQVLDVVLASRTVPPGAKGAIFSAVDHLRARGSNVYDLARAEQISLEMHRLEVGLRGGDENAVASARTALKALAISWLNARICGKQTLAGALRGHRNVS